MEMKNIIFIYLFLLSSTLLAQEPVLLYGDPIDDEIILDGPVMTKKNNPYPLSDKQWNVLMKKNEKIIEKYKGQKIAALPETQKDELLTAMARQAVLIYTPAFYRDYGKPVIEVGKFEGMPYLGRKYYEITFLYDMSKELFTTPYIIKLSILEDEGYAIMLDYPNDGRFGLYYKTKSEEEIARKEYLADRTLCKPYCALPEKRKEKVKNSKEFRKELEYYQDLLKDK
ncbi:MAG: hypothetical protein LBS20_09595 [Prevotella sp.]|jgi:hypothetical protein|nr:hypothetical protein [Prevotella sp.]